MATNNAVNANSTTPLPIVDGGTQVITVTTAPTANAFAGWDANKNLSANNHIEAYTTTATAAGTTTLTVASTYLQYFTGSTTQTVVLPVTSTLVLGQQFYVANNSSGVVTVQSSGLNSIVAMAASTVAVFTCILTSGTTAASWTSDYNATVAGVNSITGTANQVIASASTGAVTLSLPQSIATTSAVQFNSVQLNSNNGLLDSNGKEILQLSPGGASVVNNLTIINTTTGASPILAATGSDSNVALTLRSQNTAVINLISSSLANFLTVSPSATTVPVTISAQGTDINIILSLVGKGNGGVATQGTTAAGNATAGFVGEVISSSVASASGVSLTTATSANVTSISLTAGDWDISGNVFINSTAVSLAFGYVWTSLTSATIPDISLVAGLAGTTTLVANIAQVTPYLRVNVSGSQTVFLSTQASFATGVVKASGNIFARRVR